MVPEALEFDAEEEDGEVAEAEEFDVEEEDGKVAEAEEATAPPSARAAGLTTSVPSEALRLVTILPFPIDTLDSVEQPVPADVLASLLQTRMQRRDEAVSL